MLATIGPMIWWTTVAMTQGRMATNLTRQRADLLFVEAEHLGGNVAREQAEHMVQRNGEHGNEHDGDAVGCELVSVWADAQTLHEDDAGGGSLDKEIFKAVYAVATDRRARA